MELEISPGVLYEVPPRTLLEVSSGISSRISLAYLFLFSKFLRDFLQDFSYNSRWSYFLNYIGIIWRNSKSNSWWNRRWKLWRRTSKRSFEEIPEGTSGGILERTAGNIPEESPTRVLEITTRGILEETLEVTFKRSIGKISEGNPKDFKMRKSSGFPSEICPILLLIYQFDD